MMREPTSRLYVWITGHINLTSEFLFCLVTDQTILNHKRAQLRQLGQDCMAVITNSMTKDWCRIFGKRAALWMVIIVLLLCNFQLPRLPMKNNNNYVIPAMFASPKETISGLPKKNQSFSSNTAVSKDSTKPRIHVFYHIFAGKGEEYVSLAESIVDEQTHYVAKVAKQQSSYNWELYFRVVGSRVVSLGPRLVERPVCTNTSNLQCHYNGRKKHAHEEFTLQAILEFCQANPSETVVYIHTKGSYHDTDYNEPWRRFLTAGALHSSCIETIQRHSKGDDNDNACNICGLQFFPYWVPMVRDDAYEVPCVEIVCLLYWFRSDSLQATCSRPTARMSRTSYHPCSIVAI